MKRGLLHYAPEDGWFGDPMPVYADGVYHIYYTKLSDKQGWLCWGHVATRDWKEYQELPDCLLPDDRDVSLTTGSVLYHEGVYHAFYAACGTDGIYRIFSAVSRDGVLFEKNRESLLPEGRPGYRGDDTWRDPCVFWNPAESCFWMVFCARLKISIASPACWASPNRRIWRTGGCAPRFGRRGIPPRPNVRTSFP